MLELAVNSALLSTYRRIEVIVRPDSGVAAAWNVTGEVTVEFGAGVQILTDPATPDGAHCAARDPEIRMTASVTRRVLRVGPTTVLQSANFQLHLCSLDSKSLYLAERAAYRQLRPKLHPLSSLGQRLSCLKRTVKERWLWRTCLRDCT